MSKRNELLADGILAEMLENHSDFRDSLVLIENALNDKRYKESQDLLRAMLKA